MKRTLLVACLFLATSAFAHCANPAACEAKAIDMALSSESEKIPPDTLEKVKSMRAEGMKLYDEGHEGQGLELLKNARKLLKESSGT